MATARVSGSSRVTGKRCVRDAGYRVIAGGLFPDHATIARFRVRHEKALGGLFSQVLRLLAAEGMVALGLLSLDGTKLAGNAAQKANRTLPQIGKILAEADAAEDAAEGGGPRPATPAGAGPAGGAAGAAGPGPGPAGSRGRGRRQAQQARQEAWDAAAAARRPRAGQRPADEPRSNRNNTEPRANITDPDVRVMRNQKGYAAGYNGQLVVTPDQVIVGAMLSQHPAAPCSTRCSISAGTSWQRPGSARSCAPCLPTPGMSARRTSPEPILTGCDCSRRWPGTRDRRARTPGHARNLDPLPATGRAVRRLRHPRGRDDYRLRARTVEPVFGHL